MIEFKPWPKTPRLFRDMVITEKIDGTNAAVHVRHVPLGHSFEVDHDGWPDDVVASDGENYLVRAQSRKRLITPEDDNFGFAAWVRENAAGLARALGEGAHYGEWWGSGIQRGYGLPKGEKRFSLFNVNRYTEPLDSTLVPGLGVVPKLYEGPFDTEAVAGECMLLERHGSHAAPGFMKPEGVVVFHSASNSVFKALIENDSEPKGVR